jgi:hypothetical protein
MGAMVAVGYCCELGGVGAEGGPTGAGDVGYEGRVSGRVSMGVDAGDCAECPFVYGAWYGWGTAGAAGIWGLAA